MQILKICILFIVFLLSNYIGKMIAGKYKYRLDELVEIKNLLNIFKTKIKFTYEPIPQIFGELSKTNCKNVGNIFEFAKEQMNYKTAGESWNDAIENSENNLKAEDKKVLSMLAKMLGETDIEGQVSQIDVTLSFLDKQIERAEQEKNKNEKLYRKLGTIMGLAIVIILI